MSAAAAPDARRAASTWRATPFPGNVRELENLLHRAVALSAGEAIDARRPRPAATTSFAEQRTARARRRCRRARPPRRAGARCRRRRCCRTTCAAYLDDVERDILVRALEQHRFNRTAAGASLGLSLRQMRYRMARLGINVGGDVGERGDARLKRAPRSGATAGAARARRCASPNFGARPGRRDGRPGRAPLDQPAAGRVRRRCDRAPVHQPARLGRASVLRSRSAACEVSAHFLIRRDGELLQFVSCDDRAWHAGASRWRGRDDCNDFSIGIELEGLEGERFEAAQYDALAALLRGAARALSDRATSPATSTSRRAASTIPAPASTGRAAARARCGWRASSAFSPMRATIDATPAHRD